MTNAEAIEILKLRRRGAECLDCLYVDGVDIEAIDMAISALEKQNEKKPLTNADRIRAMTDEKLAEFLPSRLCPSSRIHYGKKNKYTKCPTDERIRNCVDCWLDWLKQEVKDNG